MRGIDLHMIDRALFAGALIGAVLLASCQNAGPPCDSTDDTCSAPSCVSDSDCITNDPRTVCKAESSQCALREGFADDCDANRPCAFGEFCSSLLGRCLDSSEFVNCTRRSQCSTGQICDRGANKCIPIDECFGDSFCEPDEVCDLIRHSCRIPEPRCIPCDDGQCPDDLICDEATSACVAPDLQSPCRSSQRCNHAGFCAVCFTGKACSLGSFCHPVLGQCDPSEECADTPAACPSSDSIRCRICAAPLQCNSATAQCQAPPPPCRSDLDCPNQQRCDFLQSRPVCTIRSESCLDDTDEPNNTAAQSTFFSTENSSTSRAFRLCPANEDWFRINVASGTFLRIDAQFRHLQGNIDLQLYLDDGTTLISESVSLTDNERLEIEAGTDRTYLLRVFGRPPASTAISYQLDISREPGPVCPDDGLEPNDNIAQAVLLTPQARIDAHICPGDPDWYVLPRVRIGTRLQVDLSFIDNRGDLDLEIYRGDQLSPLRASRSTTDNETIDFSASFSGDIFVRVVPKANDSNTYTLRSTLQADPGGIRCLDDRFEPNNTIESAVSWTSSQNPQPLSLCAQDNDWFAVSVNAGEILEAEIEFRPSISDLELALYGPEPDTQLLRVADGRSSREFLSFFSLQEGTYFIRIFGAHPLDEAEYTLRLNTYRETPCLDDSNDQLGLGNLRSDPVRLETLPLSDSFTICRGDEDWYHINLPGGFESTLRVQYPSSLASIDLELYTSSGELIESTTSQDSDSFKELRYISSEATTKAFAVRVMSLLGDAAPYQLSIDLRPIFTCVPDIYEPNNTPSEASGPLRVLSSTQATVLRDLSLCPSTRRSDNLGLVRGDEDFFWIDPTAGSVITASISFTQGDLLLELLGSDGLRACTNDGVQRCYSDGSRLSESIRYSSTSTSPLLLRVGSIYSAPEIGVQASDADTTYSLEVRSTN